MEKRKSGSRGDPLWVGYLLAGALTVAAYYTAVHTGGPPALRVTLYCLVSASAAAAVLLGCVRNRPRSWLPWMLLGLSQVIYAAADANFYVTHFILRITTFPAVADVLYLSHYPLVVAGLVLLIRRRNSGRDVPSLLDAALLAVVAGMLSWLYLIGPQAEADSPVLVKVASVAYPMMDLAMFAVAVRLILGRGRRNTAFVLLSTNLLAFFAADSVYVFQQLNQTYAAGNFLDAFWLSGNLALGAAALHPTMARITDPGAAPDRGPGPLRITALCAAALIAPATLLVQYASGAYASIPVVGCACAILFVLTIARLAGLVSEQRRLAITDSLTGLRTRRFFEAELPAEINRARRASSPLAVLIADVDHFKSINDRYGHPAGDRVLVEISRRLRRATRDNDILARYGGEEFALLIRGTGGEEPAVIGERIRRAVADSPIEINGGHRPIEVTISVGTASFPLHGTTPADLVGAADRALYAAKNRGRDRVVGWPAAPEPDEDAGITYLQRIADEVDGWLSTQEHGRAVGRWAALVAAEMDRSPASVRRAELAGRLHDVGKILVPKEIWEKRGPLTDAEWEQVRQHPVYGYRLVLAVPGLGEVADVIRQHHERFDGEGYPDRLAGTAIRFEARILAVCDTWAAMLADRPYQRARTEAEATRELLEASGTQLDPQVVTAFLALHARGALGALPQAGATQPG
ncbi:diguanylate cyclase [Amycolatopsis sp. YIM 10]|uniref:bifunctional diguanylate cyclase/phosphohydrolase n=1 Tax=Amycolatopsis sp. YIM 10 TaxID=2653857 RepID=UPI00128FE7B2|nr:diguanylate cyclase [Amycolatopsis sp. YIM 10]QFU90797.1 Response regulator PleD [Amycolatopsis sp. YIM 10]